MRCRSMIGHRRDLIAQLGGVLKLSCPRVLHLTLQPGTTSSCLPSRNMQARSMISGTLLVTAPMQGPGQRLMGSRSTAGHWGCRGGADCRSSRKDAARRPASGTRRASR